MSTPQLIMSEKERHQMMVLSLISGGLILILLAIVGGLFLTPRALPNWAENVLVSIATASALKLGDCLSTLVALASGGSVERLGNKLAESAPLEVVAPAPPDVAAASQQVADAAQEEADQIEAKT
jgi:hypothetical protein